MKKLLLIVGFTLLARFGFCADGWECTPNTTPACTSSSTTRTWFLCHNKLNGSTGCGPVAVDTNGALFCTVNIAEVPASCTLTAITVQESHVGAAGGQTVWHTLGVFGVGTGVGPYTPASIDPLRPVGPGLMASYSNPADTDCDTGGRGINVTYTCFYGNLK